MTINCIIIEDERPAMELMEDNISKIPWLELVGTCKSTFAANELLMKENVDLIFSDVEMPIVSGIQFLKTLRYPPLIILTTAYEQYALEGYEMEVVDYLLKPFSFHRFLKAVNKAQQQYMFRNDLAKPEEEGFLFVFSEYKEVKVFFKDIIYIEGLKDYVKIFLDGQKTPLLTRLNLKAMLSKLPRSKFCRVHNSYIIPFNRITSVQKTRVYLGKLELPVGNAFSGDFLSQFKSLD